MGAGGSRRRCNAGWRGHLVALAGLLCASPHGLPWSQPTAAQAHGRAHDGGPIELNSKPLPCPYRVQGGRVLFPLRALAEALQARFSIDPQRREILCAGRKLRSSVVWIASEPYVTYRGLLQALGPLRYGMRGSTACFETSPEPVAQPCAPSPTAITSRDSASPSEAAMRVVWVELNRARTAPSAYAERLAAMRGQYQGRIRRLPDGALLETQEGLPALDEAIAFLRQQSPCPALTLSQGLSRAAADHVADQGLTPQTGHSGTDGSSPASRMSRHGTWQQVCGENIAYGAQPEEVVAELIIDDGVADRGHRANIYNPAFLCVGLALGRHKRFGLMCVMDLAGGFQDAP